MNPPYAHIRTRPVMPAPEGQHVRHIVSFKHSIFVEVDIWITNESHIGYYQLYPGKEDQLTMLVVKSREGQREFYYDLTLTDRLSENEIYNDFSALATLAKLAYERGQESYKHQSTVMKNKRYTLQDGVEHAAQGVFKVYLEQEGAINARESEDASSW